MRAGLLALLLLLAPLPLASATARCDYNYSDDYALGNSYVHATSHRCTWTSGGATHTQRLDRYDAFVYDPYAPTGLRAGGTLYLQSSETRNADGSGTTEHRLYAEKDGVSLSLSYAGSRTFEGRERCTATASAYRTPTTGTDARTPLLPACWPDGFLLP